MLKAREKSLLSFFPEKSRSHEQVGAKEMPLYFIVLLVGLILLSLGLLNLYSATGGSALFYAQLKHAMIGIIAMIFIGFFISQQYLNMAVMPFFVLNLLLLGLVLVAGDSAGGAQRWIALGPIRMQPSELTKICALLLVAKYLNDHRSSKAYAIGDLLPLIGGMFLLFSLIFMQPDLGTAGVMFLIGAFQMTFIKFDKKSLLKWGVVGFGFAAFSWFFLLRPYQKMRIFNLFNPHIDPSGLGYNAKQSLITIGSGGLFGKGYLEGTQTHLMFLPARQTDFIFSVYAEEHGFLMGVLLIFLYFALIYCALEISKKAKSFFACLTAIGIAGYFLLSFGINIAMVLGLFPIVGVPLPFFSHGGTSLIVSFIAIGLLISVNRDSRDRRIHSVYLRS